MKNFQDQLYFWTHMLDNSLNKDLILEAEDLSSKTKRTIILSIIEKIAANLENYLYWNVSGKSNQYQYAHSYDGQNIDKKQLNPYVERKELTRLKKSSERKNQENSFKQWINKKYKDGYSLWLTIHEDYAYKDEFHSPYLKPFLDFIKTIKSEINEKFPLVSKYYFLHANQYWRSWCGTDDKEYENINDIIKNKYISDFVNVVSSNNEDRSYIEETLIDLLDKAIVDKNNIKKLIKDPDFIELSNKISTSSLIKYERSDLENLIPDISKYKDLKTKNIYLKNFSPKVFKSKNNIEYKYISSDDDKLCILKVEKNKGHLLWFTLTGYQTNTPYQVKFLKLSGSNFNNKIEEIVDGYPTIIVNAIDFINFPDLKTIKTCENIITNKISFVDCPNLTSLDGIPKSLKPQQSTIVADNIGIFDLKGLSNISSLRQLDIRECSELKSLEGIPSQIEIFVIMHCPKLTNLNFAPVDVDKVIVKKQNFHNISKYISLTKNFKKFKKIPQKFLSSVKDNRFIDSSENNFEITSQKKNNSKNKKIVNLAPNGKPSKLNSKQWKQVRTKEFKEWFGDWENDPANSSKMLDENGEPAIFYHGSAGWNPFRISDDNIKELINSSANNKDSIEALRDSLKGFKDDTIFLFSEKDKENAKFYCDWSSHGSVLNKKGDFGTKSFSGSILQVFVNARNPLSVDFKNESYNFYSGNDENVKSLQTAIDLMLDASTFDKDPRRHINGLSRVLKTLKTSEQAKINIQQLQKKEFFDINRQNNSLADFYVFTNDIADVFSSILYICPKSEKEYYLEVFQCSSVHLRYFFDMMFKFENIHLSEKEGFKQLSDLKRALNNNLDKIEQFRDEKLPIYIESVEKFIDKYGDTNITSKISKDTIIELLVKDSNSVIDFHEKNILDLLDRLNISISSLIDTYTSKLNEIQNKLSKYDAFIGYNLRDAGVNSIQTQYVVLNPNQVKSATKNNGQFSTTSNHIMDSENRF